MENQMAFVLVKIHVTIVTVISDEVQKDFFIEHEKETVTSLIKESDNCFLRLEESILFGIVFFH